MARKKKFLDNNVVNLSALDIYANAVGALAFLLLLFAANAIELVRPSPLKILTKQLPVSRAGWEYIGVLSVIGGVPPYSWELYSGSLPDGLTLDNERGEVIGNTNQSASGRSFSFEIQVNDSQNKKARRSLSIRILSEKEKEHLLYEPLVILTHGELPDAFVDKPYTIYLAARGGSGRYRWSAEGLPQNFTLQPFTGLLKGKPEVLGTSELILKVSDQVEGRGDSGQVLSTASLRIVGIDEQLQAAEVLPHPRILTESLPPAAVSESYNVQLAGEGLDPLNWSAQNLPLGLTVSNNGVVKGVPISAMEEQIIVKMKDARNLSASDKTILLIVKPQPISTLVRFKKRGIWSWLGYLIIILCELVFIFILNLQASRDFDIMLKTHNVTFIKKPDGTRALSGAKVDREAVERQSKYMYYRYHKYKLLSYSILIVVIFGYTIFLLS